MEQPERANPCEAQARSWQSIVGHVSQRRYLHCIYWICVVFLGLSWCWWAFHQEDRDSYDVEAPSSGERMKILPALHTRLSRGTPRLQFEHSDDMPVNRNNISDRISVQNWKSNGFDPEFPATDRQSDIYSDIFGEQNRYKKKNIQVAGNPYNQKTTLTKRRRQHGVAKNYRDTIINSRRNNKTDTYHDQLPLIFSPTRDFVQNCITGDVIGRIPRHLRMRRFTPLKNVSPESGQRRRDSFQKVFETRGWGKDWDTNYDGLKASGHGATLSWTQEIMGVLHIVISRLKEKLGKSRVKILDLPCGDMAWMSRFLMTRNDVDYTGVDIIPDLISHHKKAFKSFPWRFRLFDILEQPLNESFDLILCRTLLQHLHDADASKVLGRFSESGSLLLLTTTFSRIQMNTKLEMVDTNPGRFRKLNLEIPPISLRPPLCLQRDGHPHAINGWEHFVGLWGLPLEQIPDCVESIPMSLKDTAFTVYSCVDWSVA